MKISTEVKKKKKERKDRKKLDEISFLISDSFGLVGFYGISTIVGYLMPNPLYTYILNI